MTRSAPRLLIHLAIYSLAVAMVFPFLWMLSTSLKPAEEVFTALVPFAQQYNGLPL